MNSASVNDFTQLNGNSRGNILRISKSGTNYDILFSPTIATPVLMEIISSDGSAGAYYSISNNSQRVSGIQSLGIWTGAASSIGACNGFNNENLPVRVSDSTYSASSACALKGEISNPQAYGFTWNDAQPGRAYYKAIFYVPEKGYSIVNACNNGQVFSTPSAASGESELGLDYLSDRQIISMNNVFQLVKNRAVCVSQSDNEISFWWNENYLYGELEKSYSGYFDNIMQSDPAFRVCNAG